MNEIMASNNWGFTSVGGKESMSEIVLPPEWSSVQTPETSAPHRTTLEVKNLRLEPWH